MPLLRNEDKERINRCISNAMPYTAFSVDIQKWTDGALSRQCWFSPVKVGASADTKNSFWLTMCEYCSAINFWICFKRLHALRLESLPCTMLLRRHPGNDGYVYSGGRAGGSLEGLRCAPLTCTCKWEFDSASHSCDSLMM